MIWIVTKQSNPSNNNTFMIVLSRISHGSASSTPRLIEFIHFTDRELHLLLMHKIPPSLGIKTFQDLTLGPWSCLDIECSYAGVLNTFNFTSFNTMSVRRWRPGNTTTASKAEDFYQEAKRTISSVSLKISISSSLNLMKLHICQSYLMLCLTLLSAEWFWSVKSLST